MEENPEINITALKPLTDTLKVVQEKSLPLIINVIGGGRFSGRVKDYSAGAVVLYRVTGKENFDVYIATSQIASIEFEVRVGK